MFSLPWRENNAKKRNKKKRRKTQEKKKRTRRKKNKKKKRKGEKETEKKSRKRVSSRASQDEQPCGQAYYGRAQGAHAGRSTRRPFCGRAHGGQPLRVAPLVIAIAFCGSPQREVCSPRADLACRATRRSGCRSRSTYHSASQSRGARASLYAVTRVRGRHMLTPHGP